MSTPERGNGGANIKPLARKSIHIHCGACPFLFNEKMVRYGVNNHNKRHQHVNVDTQANQGNDEVDNVMSKFAYTSSPIQERKNSYLRRNSVDVPNDKYSSDSDDDIKLLSKSSPAFFSSLHCSDESYRSANQNERDVSANASRTSLNAESTRNRYNSRENTLSQSQNVTQVPQTFNNHSENSISSYTLIVLIIVIIAAGVAYFKDCFNFNNINSIAIRSSVYDKFSFYNDVKNLGEKYKVNDHSMLQIRTGIATIFEKQDTGSFIFAYNSQSNRFNVLMFNDFMNEISTTAARYLRNGTETGHHVVVDTSNIKTDTELLNLYRADVDRTGVMLVKDLNDIPSQLAMAFHYYCDEYNPLVKQSAIFFTLNLATCTHASDGKSTHKYIEKCLATKWHTVDEDKIGPLLTRVVNIVVDVTSIFS